MNDFFFVKTLEELETVCEELSEQKVLAIDLECENGLHHYGTFISLIQISTKKKNWVVDVLGLENINSLKKIFENPTIKKVFHDVSFDLRILYHQFKCRPKNIFDTQLAALFLGKEQIGLGSLYEEYLGIKKEKKFQRVDWTKRPLSSEMLAYAVGDTAYLLELKGLLCKELEKKGRLTWVEQENDHLESIKFEYQEQTYGTVKGVKSLSPKERGIFRSLFHEREKLAKRVDRPPFMILSNKQMLAFSTSPPHNINAWKNLKGVHPLVKRRAENFFYLVKKSKEDHKPVREKKSFTFSQRNRMKELIEKRDEVASKLEIKGHLIMNQEQAISIVVNNSDSCLRKWQKKLLGF